MKKSRISFLIGLSAIAIAGSLIWFIKFQSDAPVQVKEELSQRAQPSTMPPNRDSDLESKILQERDRDFVKSAASIILDERCSDVSGPLNGIAKIESPEALEVVIAYLKQNEKHLPKTASIQEDLNKLTKVIIDHDWDYPEAKVCYAIFYLKYFTDPRADDEVNAFLGRLDQKFGGSEYARIMHQEIAKLSLTGMYIGKENRVDKDVIVGKTSIEDGKKEKARLRDEYSQKKKELLEVLGSTQ